MKTILLIGTILTGVLLFSTIVIGLRIRDQQPTDRGSSKFHLLIGVMAAIVSMATEILALVMVYRG